jgi:methylphosphotriester-DNA--protein-cysteine methyltransferase
MKEWHLSAGERGAGEVQGKRRTEALSSGIGVHADRAPLDVASRAGFGSLRRFNAVFAEVYRRPPTALRRRGEVLVAAAEGTTPL